MELLPIIAFFVVVILLWLILRSRFRKSVAEFIPEVTYVDETLLDLIRTRQIRAAIDYYQTHAQVTTEESDSVVQYLVARPESLMLMVRLGKGDIAPLYTDETLLDYIKTGRIFKAQAYYSDKTGADLRETEVAIYAIAANPTMQFKTSASNSTVDT